MGTSIKRSLELGVVNHKSSTNQRWFSDLGVANRRRLIISRAGMLVANKPMLRVFSNRAVDMVALSGVPHLEQDTIRSKAAIVEGVVSPR